MNRLTKFRQYLSLYVFLTGLGYFVGILPTNIMGQQKHLKKISTVVLNGSVNSVKFGSETKGVKNTANMIITTDEEILFYGENGNIISRRSHKSPYDVEYSKQGKYVGLTEILQEPEKVRNGLYIFYLIDNQSRVLWEKTGEIEYEADEYGGKGPGRVFISDKDGISIVFHRPWVFDMYDSTGKLFKTVKLLEGKRSQIMAVGSSYCDWSEDGNYFAVSSQEQGSSPGKKLTTRIPVRGPMKGKKIISPARAPKSGNPWVFLFDRFGNEIWHRRIPDYQGTGISVSPKGKFVVATGITRTLTEFDRHIYIFDRAGKEIKTLNMAFHGQAFSEDGKFVLLYGGKTAKFIELSTGSLLWQRKFLEFMFSCSVSNNGNRIVVATRNYKKDNSEPKVSIFNQRGEVVLTEAFVNEKWRKYYGRKTDRIKLSSDGKRLVVFFKNKIANFKIED